MYVINTGRIQWGKSWVLHPLQDLALASSAHLLDDLAANALKPPAQSEAQECTQAAVRLWVGSLLAD